MDSKMQRDPRITLSVFLLVIMATWTMVIKYLAPVLFYYSEYLRGSPPAAIPIMWDFWPVLHLVLAYLFWTCNARQWVAGVAIAAVEIIIVVTKFAFFLSAPDWTFWRLLWFTNKVYVLAFFIWLLILLLRPAYRTRLQPNPSPKQERHTQRSTL